MADDLTQPHLVWAIVYGLRRSPSHNATLVASDMYDTADEIEDKYLKSDDSSVQESKETES